MVPVAELEKLEPMQLIEAGSKDNESCKEAGLERLECLIVSRSYHKLYLSKSKLFYSNLFVRVSYKATKHFNSPTKQFSIDTGRSDHHRFCLLNMKPYTEISLTFPNPDEDKLGAQGTSSYSAANIVTCMAPTIATVPRSC